MTKHKPKSKIILEKETYVYTFLLQSQDTNVNADTAGLVQTFFILAKGYGRASPTSSSKSTLSYCFGFGTSVPLPSSRNWHLPGEDTDISPNPAPSLRFSGFNQKICQVTLTRKTLEKSQFFLKSVWCQLHKNEGSLHQIRETFQLRNS